MRYRQLDANGDYLFGVAAKFLVNTPQAVAQAIATRLKLLKGDWFLDNRIGLDKSLILGYGTQATRDHEIQQHILDTPGVLNIDSYSSSVDSRNFTVVATVNTAYGAAQLNEVL